MVDLQKYIEYLTLNDSSALYFFSWLSITFIVASYIYINTNRIGVLNTVRNIFAYVNYLIFIYGVFILVLYLSGIASMYSYKWDAWLSILFVIHGYILMYYSAEIDYGVDFGLIEYIKSLILKIFSIYFLGIGVLKIIEYFKIYQKLIISISI